MINIENLPKAKVLKALYDNSKVQGMGYLIATGEDLPECEAEYLLSKQTHFDYLHGKVMKIDLSDDKCFEEFGYDRDNGNGAAQSVINKLKTYASYK